MRGANEEIDGNESRNVVYGSTIDRNRSADLDVEKDTDGRKQSYHSANVFRITFQG